MATGGGGGGGGGGGVFILTHPAKNVFFLAFEIS